MTAPGSLPAATAPAGAAPTLVVLSGLPATGRSTIAARLAAELGAVHVRIDTIEQAIVDTTPLAQPLGRAGHVIGDLVAEDQLRHGLTKAWERPVLVLDTAAEGVAACVARGRAAIGR